MTVHLYRWWLCTEQGHPRPWPSPHSLSSFVCFGWRVTGDPAEVLWNLSLVTGSSICKYRNGGGEWGGVGGEQKDQRGCWEVAGTQDQILRSACLCLLLFSVYLIICSSCAMEYEVSILFGLSCHLGLFFFLHGGGGEGESQHSLCGVIHSTPFSLASANV